MTIRSKQSQQFQQQLLALYVYVTTIYFSIPYIDALVEERARATPESITY
ncbi:MAG TPA: hypothetical protein PLZ21_08480 [Armatimonadota bacterium]|nr:hypothetical protein [Armatimonadota bacterium]